MQVIARTSDKDYGFNQFIRDLKRKTQNAINNDHVLAHCILIYSRANPVIAKILDDFHYYNALDEISGKFLNIYHASPNQHTRSTNGSGDIMGFMLSSDLNIYNNSAENNRIVEQLNEIFKLNLDPHNAALFFFHTNDDIITGNICLEIEEDASIEKTYSDMKGIISEVRKALSDVLPENIQNQQTIANLSETNLQTYKIVKKLKNIAANPILNIALALKQ